MSRDAIAEVLGRLDYGDGPDDVEYPLRLAEVDGLLTAGVVVDIEDLLIDMDIPLWHDLRRTLQPLGWVPLMVWSDRLVTCWAPPRTTHHEIRDALAPHVDLWHGADWWPAMLTDADKDALGIDPMDDGPGSHAVNTADELLTWLATAPAEVHA